MINGEVLAGRYRLVNRVATGGMGSVWEAWDELLHRRVAIKELLTQPGLSAEDAATARNRVIREARITARLHHPHAVSLYDVIDHGGQPCLILQYVPSRTLNSILTEQGSLQVRFVAGVGAEIASALGAAHHVGIVHRDVKPSNVLIAPSGAALITDFGISRAAGDMVLTSTGMVSGTPAFLAPEVARGAPSGFPADVFSLGATLYAALEGAPPFGADQNPMAILHKVASGQIIPPRRSGVLTTLLVQMMAADPAARPAMLDVAPLFAELQDRESAATAGSELRTVAVPPRTVRQWPADREANASPGSASTRGLRPTVAAPAGRGSRRPLAFLLAAAAVLLLTGVGSWLRVTGTRHPPPAARSSSISVPAPSTPTSASVLSSPRISGPSVTSPSAATSTPTSTSHAAAQASPREPATGRRSAGTTSSARVPAAAPRTHTTPSTSGSAITQAAPTPGQLVAAITDYYAVLPGDTDKGWADLTSRFQKGTAQNRQYYQRFWSSIQRVTVTDAHGASPDTAEAKITYYFKDGRTAVEITVYSLVARGGALKIDSSTVLSSIIQ